MKNLEEILNYLCWCNQIRFLPEQYIYENRNPDNLLLCSYNRYAYTKLVSIKKIIKKYFEITGRVTRKN